MHDAEDTDWIHQCVQATPVLPTETTNHRLGGGDSQRDHQDEPRHTDHDIRTLDQVLDQIIPVELHIKECVRHPVQHDVPEREESHRAAMLREPVPAQHLTQRRYRHGCDQKAERPLTKEVFRRLDGVAPEDIGARDDIRQQRADSDERGDAGRNDQPHREPCGFPEHTDARVQVAPVHAERPAERPAEPPAERTSALSNCGCISSSFGDPSPRTSSQPDPRSR